MSSNTNFLIQISKDNLDIVRQNKKLVPNTCRLFINPLKTQKFNNNLKIRLLPTTTSGAIQRYYQKKYTVTALNFANSHNPGGGYLQGHKAQEEDLCRLAPFLYASLNDVKKMFYPFDYSKTILFTPNVLFVREDNTYKILDKNKYVSNIITAAAPDFRRVNLGGYNAITLLKFYEKHRVMLEALITDIYFSRILYKDGHCAPDKSNKPINKLEHKKSVLVLGAFGCGAFRPQVNMMYESLYPMFIASCFMKVLLKTGGGHYSKVVFAIPDSGSVNYKAFASVLDLINIDYISYLQQEAISMN